MIGKTNTTTLVGLSNIQLCSLKTALLTLYEVKLALLKIALCYVKVLPRPFPPYGS